MMVASHIKDLSSLTISTRNSTSDSAQDSIKKTWIIHRFFRDPCTCDNIVHVHEKSEREKIKKSEEAEEANPVKRQTLSTYPRIV